METIFENLKLFINETNFKINDINKNIILQQIHEYLTFIKTKSCLPDKIQKFEIIEKDYLLFLYLINNIDVQLNNLINSFNLKLDNIEYDILKKYIVYFYNTREIIFNGKGIN